MSSHQGEKQSKGKSKKSLSSKISKSTKGSKDGNLMVEKFRGDGMNFKCKLLGVAEVDGPRGDSMCMEAIKKLKIHQRQSGEHKMKIIFNITLMGIRIQEERTKNILFEHPVNKVSFITHDQDDKKIFSFISSAKCSAGSVGHMMYAIKYDKVAGIITSTLYDLFQVVFKLRQEAALKQRKAQKETLHAPLSSLASSNTFSNGPSGSEDTNIYEEPNASSKIEAPKEEDEPTHYKVPIQRPLPPAPYSSQVNQPGPESNADLSNQSTISASDNFFSSSVFSTAEQDTISELSVDVPRRGSISSSVSSTSETASYDSRTLDVKTGALSTPPIYPKSKNDAPNGTVPSVDNAKNSELKPMDEDPDYETIPSDLVKNIPKTNETKTTVGQFHFKESFGDDESFPSNTEQVNSKNNDPFFSEKTLKRSEESPPSSAVFGTDDDFFSSNFHDKADSASKTDFSFDDPFAPKSGEDVPQNSQVVDPFASTDAFDNAFGTAFQSEEIGDQAKDEGVISTKPETNGSVESNTSEQVPTEDYQSNQKEPSYVNIQNDLSWSNVFENKNPDVDSGQSNSSSWATAFQENSLENTDSKSPKDEKKEVMFSFSEAFDKKETEEQDNKQTPDAVALEPDFSWAEAFKDKTQPEVSFSWDDAFGQETEKDNSEAKGYNESEKNDEKGSNAFNPFDDGFSSTPFKPFDKQSSKDVFSIDNSADTFSQIGKFQSAPEESLTEANSQEQAKDNHFLSDTNLNPFKSEQTALSKTNNIGDDTFQVNFENILDPKIVKESDNGNTQLENQNAELSKPANLNKTVTFGAEPKLSTEEGKDDEIVSKPVNIPLIVEPDVPPSDSTDNDTRPISLLIQESKIAEKKDSPSAPPPLPPRPVMAPLPSLPPRPTSSPYAGQIPPTPPRPSATAPSPASRTPKRAPPPPPPRIDLQDGKVSTTDAKPTNPFSISDESWKASWTSTVSTDKTSTSKKSPDPFGDEFFTDFSFHKDEAKQNTASTEKGDFFSDPFVSKDAPDSIFKADFGGVDPFAGFSADKETVDPFASDRVDMFSGFSNNDPFVDSVDPFADKGNCNQDPFAVSPKKNNTDGNMALQLTKNSDGDDFAEDSFA